MIISEDKLVLAGGFFKSYKKGEFIFHEGESARYYYQIREGSVKMINVNFDGKEFIQGLFEKGCSFGEPPLFITEAYPSTAVAATDCRIIKLKKEKFFKLLEDDCVVQRNLLNIFAMRIYNKAITSREIINNTPEHRILGFLRSYKKRNSSVNDKIHIPYTRQDIANFTGLRVETVIRTLSKMKIDNKVDIVDRKLMF